MRAVLERGSPLVGAALAGLLAVGCSNVTLKEADKAPPPPRDDRLSVTGSFCADAPKPVDFPLKVLFIVDISGSMAWTDPVPATCTPSPCLSRRGQAILDVVNTYPPGDGVEYAIIKFDGTAGIITRDNMGNDGFTDDPDRVKVVLPQLNTSLASTSGQTNFGGALLSAFQLLQVDMTSLEATRRARARYVIVFLSDGAPEPPLNAVEEAGVVATVQSIKKLETEQQLAELVFHSIFLAGPTVPPQDQVKPKQLLARFSQTGGGSFRTIEQNEKLSFFYIDFRSFIRDFILKNFIVSNTNAQLADGESRTDTDGDGIEDDHELIYGTDSTRADSDGDGFNDLLEVRLRGAGFDPSFPDADCAFSTDKIDQDGDGLLNCEERFIGTNSRLNDSDADGLPDRYEFLFNSNPVAIDSLLDDDFDGLRNGNEVGSHTNPQVDDSAYLSVGGYRYNINEQPVSQLPGQHCYDFQVDNITLVPGTGTGENLVLLQLVSAPADSPDDFGNHKVACLRPQYTLIPTETKRPANGKMVVPLEAFKTVTGDPSLPEVFNVTRDCILP